MRASSCLLAVAALVALSADRAAAQNLLANPSFETGTFAGYVVGGNASASGVAAAGTVVGGTAPTLGPSEVVARSGRFAAYGLVCQGADPITCPGAPEVLRLTQTMAVAPGTVYEIGLWVGARTAAGGGFSVSVLDGFFQLFVDGQGLLPPGAVLVPGDGTYQRIAATFASGGRSTVTVTYQLTGSGTGRALLSADDLFVQQVVPEPSTVVLLGGALALLGGVMLCPATGGRRRPRRRLMFGV